MPWAIYDSYRKQYLAAADMGGLTTRIEFATIYDDEDSSWRCEDDKDLKREHVTVAEDQS